MSTILPYISAIVAFAALLIAIAGKPKWDSSQRGFRRLKPTGRLTTLLGVLALFSTISLTWIAQEAAEEQRTQRKRIVTVAHTELRHALHTMLGPFYMALSRSTREFVKYSMPEFDLIPSGVNMLDTHIRVALAETDLNAISPYYRLRWGKTIQDAAVRGYVAIDRVKQTYAAYLDSHILVLLSELQRSELLFRLRDLDRIVTANRGEMKYPEPRAINPLPSSTEEIPVVVRDERPFPFYYAEPNPEHPWGYENFWGLIADLDKALIKDEAQLRTWGKR